MKDETIATAAPRVTADPRMSAEIERRRTFAIISHPDAGKTTLTEKFLLYAGVLADAGSVKARTGRRAATSDWMEMEQKRGISISSTALSFDYREYQLNLLDTPGHADFSEDTYRTLTAVDSALMVIDGAKGVEDRTIKLMNVCRLRDTPIISFVNKMDRDIRDPIELLDEIEEVLAMGCWTPRESFAAGPDTAADWQARVRRLVEGTAGANFVNPLSPGSPEWEREEARVFISSRTSFQLPPFGFPPSFQVVSEDCGTFTCPPGQACVDGQCAQDHERGQQLQAAGIIQAG